MKATGYPRRPLAEGEALADTLLLRRVRTRSRILASVHHAWRLRSVSGWHLELLIAQEHLANSRRVTIMQRLHSDDLAQRILVPPRCGPGDTRWSTTIGSGRGRCDETGVHSNGLASAITYGSNPTGSTKNFCDRHFDRLPEAHAVRGGINPAGSNAVECSSETV